MTRARAGLQMLLLIGLLVLAAPRPADAQPVGAFPGIDCTESPTPDTPNEGLAAFFAQTPRPLPAQEDPFAPGAKTTIYQQYGYAGLRWHTYDLGCGPDAARNPDAVIGTALSNWINNIPISMAALTSSITAVAFNPTFLNIFDPAIGQISSSLHRSLFATWVPAVIALLGIVILLRARRSALATTAAAIGWALMVILIATAIFRWPLQAGHVADQTVTSTLGAVVNGVDGKNTDVDPATAVASNVQEAILYKAWLAGTLGSTDTLTARKYGPRLFKAQALTWHEASVVQRDPEAGKQIIEAKKDDWKTAASQIKDSDPAAYEHLTGKRSDTRVGYALLSTVAAVLALPFLLVSALLLLGSFLIVRLAVMMFPAFATIGIFPAGRGLVLGIGRTVGAALVNAVIFGIGAAVTIRVLGLILDPQSRLPGWLALVLMPLFGFAMWVGLKPFRRLTAMVSPNSNPFGDTAGSFGNAARNGGRWAKKAGTAAAAAYTGNLAAAATVAAADDEPAGGAPEAPVPDRVEARPQPSAAPPPPVTGHAAPDRPALMPAPVPGRPQPRQDPPHGPPPADLESNADTSDPGGRPGWVTSQTAPT